LKAAIYTGFPSDKQRAASASGATAEPGKRLNRHGPSSQPYFINCLRGDALGEVGLQRL
jgi:hypothetical protein